MRVKKNPAVRCSSGVRRLPCEVARGEFETHPRKSGATRGQKILTLKARQCGARAVNNRVFLSFRDEDRTKPRPAVFFRTCEKSSFRASRVGNHACDLHGAPKRRRGVVDFRVSEAAMSASADPTASPEWEAARSEWWQTTQGELARLQKTVNEASPGTLKLE